MASGSGSNAEMIIKHFQESKIAKVSIVVSNNRSAFVLKRAENAGVKTAVFNRKMINDSQELLELFKQEKIDFIILAGFMLLLPPYIIDQYRDKIINIHPALLPKFGGQGMYGDFVHQAVIASKESISGITIHKVNEVYDSGDIIFQASLVVNQDDTPESLAQRIHLLEHKFYPAVIESEILKADNKKH